MLNLFWVISSFIIVLIMDRGKESNIIMGFSKWWNSFRKMVVMFNKESKKVRVNF